MLSRSIDTVKNNLLRTKRDFDFSEYFKSAEERLRAPATELSDLRMRLRETTGLGRIGQETSVQGLQPYRIKELGLKSAIEGLLAYPLLDVVEIDLDKLRQVYTVEGEWFPFQVKSHDLTFDDDDDASIFTSTEHFSERHVSQAKEILKEIASRAKFPSPSATRCMWARTSARAYNRPIIQPASQPTFASIGLPPWPRSAKKQSARNYEGRLRDVRRAARATNLLGYSFGDDRLAALRLQVRVGKPQNLKTAGITDDPEIQLAPFPVSGRNFDKARQTGLLFDGSVDAR